MVDLLVDPMDYLDYSLADLLVFYLVYYLVDLLEILLVVEKDGVMVAM